MPTGVYMSDHYSALQGDNAALLEEFYKKYKQNPSELSSDWVDFFRNLESNGSAGIKMPVSEDIDTHLDAGSQISLLRDMGIQNLLNTYRSSGHLAADLDPLKIAERDRSLIDKKLNSLSEKELNTELDSGIPALGRTTLKKIIEWFERTYCSTIGAEHYYLVDFNERSWLQSRMESTANSEQLDKYTRLRLFEKLYQADFFEKFLGKKYIGKKRFSLEGGESLIPMLDTLVERAGELDMKGLVIGMAHRGRLNVLENVIEKPASQIFAEFEENTDPDTIDYADVKYHLGYTNMRMTRAHKEIKLSLMFNPSHLEAVNPVVLGSVRSRQKLLKDESHDKVMGILIHGDAAFPGQGVVAETLNMMNLPGYTTGGTVHIVVNNQVGFTTRPSDSRSTIYATDLAKGFQIPIYHVNGDDPEAVYRVITLAMEYRQKFKKDVIIDLICYRRLGHNEMDEPSFTQPMMYSVIRKHPTTAAVYEERLREYDDITDEEIEYIKNGVKKGLENTYEEAHEKNVHMSVDTMQGVWSSYSMSPEREAEPATKMLSDRMKKVAEAITTVPEDFRPHNKLKRLLDTRKKMYEGETPIDWGFAEALAFGSILDSGHHIRMSGQDSERGTFSHRHAVLNDVNNGEQYIPLNHISENQGHFEIINSPLSEFSVMGFEYGYSLSAPEALVIWEAQFGDFVNGAQVIIDQFLTSSEVKWYRMSGLVLLLPHGYEGQGPEHSSARLERFLQLCAKNNMQVCNCTTPAQFFHLMRRQVLRQFKKPLVIMTPKSLLRHPDASSTIEDMEQGTFHEVMFDKKVDPEKVTRLVFCSGKVYYDLRSGIEESDAENPPAAVRIEQLYPFPVKQVVEAVEMYDNIKEVIWLQEEPENMGAWLFMEDRLKVLLSKDINLYCVGRTCSPSPAAGLHKIHEKEQKELIERAINGH